MDATPRSTLDVAGIDAERKRRGPPVIRLDPHGHDVYEPDGAVLTAFATSNNKVDIIQGPIGSGKTVAAFRRLGRHAMQQERSPRDGLRKTRWFVARNTFPELKRTTIKTWKRVWPPNLYGEVKMGSPPRHDIAFGDVRIEVDFLALDDEDDIAKLRPPTTRAASFTKSSTSTCRCFVKADRGRIDTPRSPTAARRGTASSRTRMRPRKITGWPR